jgi:excisionase family DNA binding protein
VEHIALAPSPGEVVARLEAAHDDEAVQLIRDLLRQVEGAPVSETGVLKRDYLTTGQAARALGVSIHTVKNWIDRGQLQGQRLQSRWYVRRADLVTLLDQLREQSSPVGQSPASVERAERLYREAMRQLPAGDVTRYEQLNDRLREGTRLTSEEWREFAELGQRLSSLALEAVAAEAATR